MIFGQEDKSNIGLTIALICVALVVIIAILVLIVVRYKKNRVGGKITKLEIETKSKSKCPNCGANIKGNVVECPYCNTQIQDITKKTITTEYLPK